MMMVSNYHMVSEKRPFQPTDYAELMNPHISSKHVVLNDSNVLAYLKAQGYDTSQLVKRNDN